MKQSDDQPSEREEKERRFRKRVMCADPWEINRHHCSIRSVLALEKIEEHLLAIRIQLAEREDRRVESTGEVARVTEEREAPALAVAIPDLAPAPTARSLRERARQWLRLSA